MQDLQRVMYADSGVCLGKQKVVGLRENQGTLK